MLEIRLLGQFDVRRGDTPIELPSRPAQSLLAFLVLHPNQEHRRERLAGMLWPDSDEANARSNLRHALWRLRKAIGGEYLEGDKISLAFRPGEDCWVDVYQLEAEIPPEADDSAWAAALEVYRGPLLPGFYEDWVLRERERLHARVEARLQQYLDRLMAAGRWEEVRHWAERWLALGQASEPAFRALMQAHAASGDLAGVAAVYQRCQVALREELGVEPSEQTRRLYERLLQGEGASAMPPPLEVESPAPPDREVPAPAFLGQGDAPGTGRREVFVGREEELARLNRHLERALAGEGQVVFVLGESGRGKTALARAFAERAHQAHPDLVVAMGTCDLHTGVGDPYLPFRDVLAMLTGDVEAAWLAGEISRDQALRLWDLMPAAVEALVERGPDLIDSFVPGEGLVRRAAAHDRLGPRARERLRAVFARKAALAGGSAPHPNRILEEYAEVLLRLAAERPLLLVLDDLHWSDVSSAALLFHLGRRIHNGRILIVGTYRPEDVRPAVGDEAHPLHTVLSELKRIYGDIFIDLDADAEARARRFIDSLLDTEPNHLDEAFREQLLRVTGGHPLFTIELLRDMRERGDLVRDAEGAWVASAHLSWDHMPARIEGVVESRIGRLEDSLREALAIASVEGDVFTAEAVAMVQGAEPRDLVRRLSAELERRHRLISEVGRDQVGERRLTQYRFRHSLIQRYLYQSLGAGERAYLHEALGEALEALYADERERIAVQLARHFQEAGAWERAVPYLVLVGERALAVSANSEAAGHLRQALRLMDDLAQRSGIAWDAGQRAHVEHLLGEALYRLGDLQGARERLEAAAALLKKAVPRGRGGLVARLLSQALLQALRRLGVLAWLRSDEPARSLLRQAAAVHKLLAEIYLVSNETVLTLYVALRGLNLAERAGPCPELAHAYADMAAAAPLLKVRPMAEVYRRRARRTAQEVGRPPVQAYVDLATSAYLIGEGRWNEAYDALLRANQIHSQIGDWNRLGIGLMMMAHHHLYRGQFAESKAVYDEMRALARRSGSLQHRVWALDGQAENLLRLGDPARVEEAASLLEQARQALEAAQAHEVDQHETMINAGLRALAFGRLGDWEAAHSEAERALTLMLSASANFFTLLEGYAAVTQTLIWLCERQGQADDLLHRARAACAKLEGYAGIFPIGRPRAALCRGLLLWLSGRRKGALGAWKRGLEAAQALAMPYEEGLLRLELGRRLPSPAAASQEHLRRALDLFTQVGAGEEARQTQSLLARD